VEAGEEAEFNSFNMKNHARKKDNGKSRNRNNEQVRVEQHTMLRTVCGEIQILRSCRCLE